MEKKFFRLDDDWFLKAQSSLTNSELRILLFVAMNVNGFNQSPVNISHSTIGKTIDMKRPHVSSALKSLVEKDWLKISQKGYSLKTGYLSRKGTESVPILNCILDLNGTESVQLCGTESVPSTESVHDRYEIRTCDGTESVPVLSYSKENTTNNKKNSCKENKKENFDLSGFSESMKTAFTDFIQMRISSKKPMTERAFELIKKKLEKIAKSETDRIEVLNRSTINQWADIYELREQKTMGKGKRWDDGKIEYRSISTDELFGEKP